MTPKGNGAQHKTLVSDPSMQRFLDVGPMSQPIRDSHDLGDGGSLSQLNAKSILHLRKNSLPAGDSRSFLRLNGQNVLDTIDMRDHYQEKREIQ